MLETNQFWTDDAKNKTSFEQVVNVVQENKQV